MRLYYRRAMLVLLLALPLAWLASNALAWGGTSSNADRTPTVPIAAGQPKLPPGATEIGPLPSTWPLRLIVGLSPRHQELLAAWLRLRGQSKVSPSSATLTPAQIGELFGASDADQRAVISYLRSYGLSIQATYPDRLLLDVEGRAGQVSAAFGTTLVRYRDRHGRLHFAETSMPRVPVRLAGLVSSIVGLRNTAVLSHAPLLPHALHPPLGGAQQGTVGQQRMSQTLPPDGFITPAQIRAAYDITPLYSQTLANGDQPVAITGAGQSVGLVEFSPFDPADSVAYDLAFGIQAPSPIVVPVDGGPTEAFGQSGRQEVALDVELVQAVAPGARILLYSGPATATGADNTTVDDAYAKLINDNLVQVLSTSWGQCEPDQLADTPADSVLFHNLLMQAKAEGMTVVAATGDGGANDCSSGRTNPSLDYPASDPLVIAVGGTSLTMTTGGAMQNETGWYHSGGGASQIYQRPDWQSGAGLPQSTWRLAPDVALNAGTSYAVQQNGAWLGVSGTSGAAPVWGALLALFNASRYAAAQAAGAPTPGICRALPGLGDVHAAFYQIAGTPPATPGFRDIVSGADNGAGAPGPGWDFVTGWGVPDAYALMKALIARSDMVAPTPIPCPTNTATPTDSQTMTATPTNTATPTATFTPTYSPSPSPTYTYSPTLTSTPSATTTATATIHAAVQSVATFAPSGVAPRTGAASATLARTPSPQATARPRTPKASPSATLPVTASRGAAAATRTPSPSKAQGKLSGTSTATPTQKATKAKLLTINKKLKLSKKLPAAKPAHLVIPKLVATAAIHPVGSAITVQLMVRWAPAVTLHVTIIAHNQPRRHIDVHTNRTGSVTSRFQVARPGHNQVRSLVVRVWGVYLHHRKTIVLRLSLHG